jgi:hypothetical protein
VERNAAIVFLALGRDLLFGSCSKLGTSISILKYRENGWLGIHDSLALWFPPMKDIDRGISIRQSPNHPSGIADVNEIPGYADSILAELDRVFTREEILRWVGPPRFTPGTLWEYSNTKYFLAGMIVERATGRAFPMIRRPILYHKNPEEPTIEDFEACARSSMLKRGRAGTIIGEVRAAVRRWPEFAAEARLSDEWTDTIRSAHCPAFPAGCVAMNSSLKVPLSLGRAA